MNFPETNDEACQVYWWNFPPDPPPAVDLDDMTEEEMDALAVELTEMAKRSLKGTPIVKKEKECQCGAKYDTVAIHYRWCDAFEEK